MIFVYNLLLCSVQSYLLSKSISRSFTSSKSNTVIYDDYSGNNKYSSYNNNRNDNRNDNKSMRLFPTGRPISKSKSFQPAKDSSSLSPTTPPSPSSTTPSSSSASSSSTSSSTTTTSTPSTYHTDTESRTHYNDSSLIPLQLYDSKKTEEYEEMITELFSSPSSFSFAYSVPSSTPPFITSFFQSIINFLQNQDSNGIPLVSISSTRQREQRELKNRSYAAKKSSFKKNPTNVTIGESLYTEDDLTTVPVKETLLDGAYQTLWFRAGVVVAAYTLFPPFLNIIRLFTDDENAQVVTGTVLPGLGILFGTLISLTYSILFTRQATLQNIATEESSDLAILTTDINALFGEDNKRKHIAFGYIWDHAETLIERSRLQELLQITNNLDPLLGVMQCLNEVSNSKFLSTHPLYQERKEEVMDIFLPSARTSLNNLLRLRSGRLNQESLTLPGVHFWILILLSIYQLLGFAVVVASDYKEGCVFPSLESRLLFSLLTGVFAFSINFAADLNQPFKGAYQVRRSSTSAFLIQVYETIRQDIAKERRRVIRLEEEQEDDD